MHMIYMNILTNIANIKWRNFRRIWIKNICDLQNNLKKKMTENFDKAEHCKHNPNDATYFTRKWD